jgi:hypothetical protein
MKSRAFQVTLLGLMLISACNKEEYFAKNVAVEGADAACSAGTDVASCEAITGCQVALEDVETMTPIFAACIANPPDPELIPPSPTDSDDEKDPAVVVTDDEDKVPTVTEAYNSKCADLDDRYLLIRDYSGNGQSHRVKKVKLCHHSSEDKHAVIVACPSLKAHISHSDELGACPVE